jgi:hypothetical protein
MSSRSALHLSCRSRISLPRRVAKHQEKYKSLPKFPNMALQQPPSWSHLYQPTPKKYGNSAELELSPHQHQALQ